MTNRNGFTYIELLITLAIIAVLFIPVMQLFSHVLYSSSYTQGLITATNLAKWEMERVKNLNMTKEQLKNLGDSIFPPGDEEPLELNQMRWRIKRMIIKESDPLEVRIHVFYDEQQDVPVITLVTLIEDMFWEEMRPIK